MTRRGVRQTIALVVCCGLTAVVTRWLTVAGLTGRYPGVVAFHRNRDALEEFVRQHHLAEAEGLRGDRLPASLRDAGITSVYRNGNFVYFVMPRTSFLADDATTELIHQIEPRAWAVDEILRTTKRVTYHIQHLSESPGWYYWMHN